MSQGGSVSANASGYQSGSSSPPESPDGESTEGTTLRKRKDCSIFDVLSVKHTLIIEVLIQIEVWYTFC